MNSNSIKVLIVVICTIYHVTILAFETSKITYFPREESKIRSMLQDSADISMAPVFVLNISQKSEDSLNVNAMEILRSQVPVSIEYDTVGGPIWQLGNASSRVLVCDSVFIPVIFDFESKVNPKVFKKIYVK